MDKLLAVRDIKALLAKIVGGTKMDEILQTTTLNRAVNSRNMDGIVFDAFRPAVWQALHAEYPIRLNPKSLKRQELGNTENPTTYVQKQLTRRKQETEGDPERDPLMATLFSPLTEIPPNARPIPVPIINVYPQQPGQWERERNPYSEAREEETYTGQMEQPGHNKNDYPTYPP